MVRFAVTPLEWLQLLYGEAPRALWLTISYKRDAATRGDNGDPFRTEWFPVTDLERAAKRAIELSSEANVYYGLGLRSQRLADDQRGAKNDVAGIPAAWVELDVAGGTHEESRRAYFPSKKVAQEFLMEDLPHRPSAIIDSGGGLHPYYIWREFWLFDERDDREHAASLLRGWQCFLRHHTPYAIDSTYDLARVLRLPGTSNRKGGIVKPVRLLFADGPRYSPSDFDDWLVDKRDNTLVADHVTLTGSAPSYEIVQALRESNRRFAATMDEKRHDMKDQSSSGYCQSLTAQLLMLGWSHQKITDFIAWWRAQKGYSAKQAGWYRINITEAMKLPTVQEQNEVAQQIDRAVHATEPEEKLAALSGLLGFRVLRIVRRLPIDTRSKVVGDPTFVFESELGTIELTTEQMRTKRLFLNIVFGRLGRHIEIPNKLWPQVSQALADSWMTEDAPDEATDQSEIRTALREYADGIGETEDPLEAYQRNLVLVMEGERWANTSNFCAWGRRHGMRISQRTATQKLLSAGMEKRRIDNVETRDGKRTSFMFWRVG